MTETGTPTGSNCPPFDWKWTNFSTRCWWNWQTGDGLQPIYANTSNEFEFESVCWKTSISNNFVSHSFAHTSTIAIRNNPCSILFFHTCMVKIKNLINFQYFSISFPIISFCTFVRHNKANSLLLMFRNISCRDGRPALRGTLPAGRGGFPAPPRAAPPCPVKMIKTAGKLQGKIKAPISTFSNTGNKWWNNITTLNKAQSSLSIGYARESKKWKYLIIFLLTGHQTLFSKICQLTK